MTQALASPSVATFASLVAKRRPAPSSWPFPDKFRAWMAENRTNIKRCALVAKIPYATFHGWVTGTVDKVPSEGMAAIARMTGLTVEYWQNDAAPYPPPVEYLRQSDEAAQLIQALDVESLAWVIDVLRNDHRRARLRALERAADGARPSGAPEGRGTSPAR